VESIFNDPVFDHKHQVKLLEEGARQKIINNTKKTMLNIENKLKKP
jgi:hypothetical protein